MNTASAHHDSPAQPIDVDALLADLLAPKTSLLEVARKHALRVEQLVEWARRPRIADLLSGLHNLADLRAGLVTAERRTEAVATLADIAAEESENREPARKAATALVRLDPAPTIAQPPDPTPPEPAPAAEPDPAPEEAPPKPASNTRDIDAEIRALAEFVSNPQPSEYAIDRVAPFLPPQIDIEALKREARHRAPPD